MELYVLDQDSSTFPTPTCTIDVLSILNLIWFFAFFTALETSLTTVPCYTQDINRNKYESITNKYNHHVICPLNETKDDTHFSIWHQTMFIKNLCYLKNRNTEKQTRLAKQSLILTNQTVYMPIWFFFFKITLATRRSNSCVAKHMSKSILPAPAWICGQGSNLSHKFSWKCTNWMEWLKFKKMKVE